MFYCDSCAENAFVIPVPTTIFKERATCGVCGERCYCNGAERVPQFWGDHPNGISWNARPPGSMVRKR